MGASGLGTSKLTSMLMIPLSYLLLARKVIGQIVREKETGMKEYLKINGCSTLSYHLSFLLSEALFALLVRN